MGRRQVHWRPSCRQKSIANGATDHALDGSPGCAAAWSPPRTSGGTPRVVVSYAVCGTDGYSALLNGLQFTRASTPLIAHVCHGASYASRFTRHSLGASFPLFERYNASRLHFNPTQLAMRKGTPSVLAAHLSNLAHCEASLAACRADRRGSTRLVLMPTNAVIFRVGLEAWVSSHLVSFCSFSAQCTDVDLQRGISALAIQMRDLEWRDAPPSRLRERVASDVAARNDSAAASDAYFGAFVRLLRDSGGGATSRGGGAASSRRGGGGGGGGGGWEARPVASMAHEGSFYPLRVLRHFVRCGVRGSLFEAALAQCEECGAPCCSLYDGRHATHGGVPSQPSEWQREVRGACTLEELLLPTFVFQRWAPLLDRASPPIVMRAWGNLFAMEAQVASRKANETILDSLVLHILANLEAHPHVFAVKTPRFTFSQSYRLLARVRGTCERHVPCTREDLHRDLDMFTVMSRLPRHVGFNMTRE
ncbi:hypothetical protein AB1Y20_002153 [Prymnesium parvum]|uniref:Uncharacterized protein n=1 Tax=Prymnesium parvum TaxID=97485 RepID=A0AB34J8K9_PRYPA